MTTSLKTNFLHLTFFAFFILFGNNCYAKEFSYSDSNESFPNPERGWYSYTLLLDNNDYGALADEGYRLAYSAIVLRDFLNRDIDIATLNKINTRFQEMRSAGMKAVLRVNYNEEEGGNNPGFAQIEQHMKQLAPIFETNKDVIAYIEAGYMGPWGEWHLSDVNNPPFPDTATSWKQLIDLLLTNNPANRFLMIRYPGKKQAVFDGQSINEQNAFTNADIARVGHHNDCFVSSNDDVGTYQTNHSSYSSTISDLKTYLKADTRFSPMGGETCAPHSQASCENTLSEMEDFRWTYMNHNYHQQVITNWKDQGCFDEIDKRLGYRLSLVNSILPNKIISGGNNTITLSIKNSGFARPWYYRTPYIRLIKNNIIVAEIAINNFDLRDIEANETKTVTMVFDVPNNISGDVDLALWLPDSKIANHTNSQYSIRLANENIWHPEHGHNILATNIPTTPSGSRPKPPKFYISQ